MQQMSFDGQSIIVTGAGRGIGRAHAMLLAERGAQVAVCDLGARTDGSGAAGDNPAAEVVAEITALGGAAIGIHADVSTQEGAQEIVAATVEAFGTVDAVINNAGIIRTAPFTDVSAQEFQRNLGVHFFGSLWVSKAAWPYLSASSAGRIVNTVSGSMLGTPSMTHYGSSKGAVFALTRNLAIEGIDAGIKVNAIAPGAMTRMAEAGADSLSAEVVEYMRTSLKPEQVAPVAAFLVHRDCSVTGEVFNVAGGQVSRMAIVNTTGIHDPELTVETVARRFGDIMAITDEAVPQLVSLDHFAKS